jgi:hypothetical protein
MKKPAFDHTCGRESVNGLKISGAIALAACAMLSCCTSVTLNVPSMENALSGTTTLDLTINSTPPGAVARTSNGAACRTPCEVSVPVTGDFTVTYSLDGYLPATVPVRSIAPVKSALIDQTPPRLEPNPVFAELKPEPPPEPPPPKRRQRP